MKNIETAILQKGGFLAKAAVCIFLMLLIVLTVACRGEARITENEFLPPQNVDIVEFSESGADRMITLAWDAPDTEQPVIAYMVYKNGEEIATTPDLAYQYTIGNNDYEFYITAIYQGEVESGPSNIINTAEAYALLPPVGPGTGEDRQTGEVDDPEQANGHGTQENHTAQGNQEETNGAAGTDPSQWDTALSGLCGNPYYPVAEGVTHTYKVNGLTLTSTITELNADGFTVSWVIPGSTQTHQWQCLPEGLIDLSQPGGGQAMEVLGEGFSVTGTSEVTGITIPSTISVGDKWTQTYSGTLSVQEFGGQMDYSAAIHYTAAAKEQITVAAGTFEAIRVDSTLEADYVLGTHGITFPLYNHSMTSSAWLVEHVGSVKSVSNHVIKGSDALQDMYGGLQDLNIPVADLHEEVSATMALIEYSLPQQP